MTHADRMIRRPPLENTTAGAGAAVVGSRRLRRAAAVSDDARGRRQPIPAGVRYLRARFPDGAGSMLDAGNPACLE